jgi:hypothetical protein
MKLIADNKCLIKSISNGPFSCYGRPNKRNLHEVVSEEIKDGFDGGKFSLALHDLIFKAPRLISDYKRNLDNYEDGYGTIRWRSNRSELSINSFNYEKYIHYIGYNHRDFGQY